MVKKKIAPVSDAEQLTPLEGVIWLLAVIITIVLAVLVVTDVVGSWAVVVPGFLGVVLALWRY